MARANTKVNELFGADLRSLAALRIGVALVLIFDICQRATDLEVFYSDFGLAPRSVAIDNLSSRWFVSFHFLSGAWQIQAILFLIAGLLACALLIGYRTRLATVGCWLFWVSLDVRNFHIFTGGDMLVRAVLFWSMFLPLGARYSVEHAWSHQDPESSKTIVSAGTIAFTVQILVLYWASVVAKSGVEWWREGSAVYYALSIDYIVSSLGHALLQLPPEILKLATWSVLGYEIVGPLLLLSPWFTGPVRTLAVLGFIVLHVNIALTLLIGLFPFIAIASILFFLPSWFWDRLLPRFIRPRRPMVTIYYDGECGFCWQSIQLIKTFFLAPATPTLAAQSNPEMEEIMRRNNSWIVVDRSGRRHLGFQGCIEVIRYSGFLAWLAPTLRLAAIQRLGEIVYRWVADHRSLGCPITAMAPDQTGSKLHLSIGATIAAFAMMGYMIVWNVANFRFAPFRIPENLRSVGNLLGMDQKWEMFAPFPAKDDGWYVVPGLLKNGRQVDLNRGGAAVDWQKPKYIALTIKNHRWRKFYELLDKRKFLPPAYASYLCRNWNRSHKGDQALRELEIDFMVEWTRPNFEYFAPRKIPLIKYQCPVVSTDPAGH